MSNIVEVEIKDVRVDTRVQLKTRGIDQGTVQDYVVALSNDVEFPPIVVFKDGLWLADGFHRIAAYRFLGREKIKADILPGGAEEAKIYAADANVDNGRPMDHKQKREAGKRLIKLTEWSNYKIGQCLAVSDVAVLRWRASTTNVVDTRTVTRNSTTYKMDTSNIGHKKDDSVGTQDAQPPSLEANDTQQEHQIEMDWLQSIQLIHENFLDAISVLKPESVDAIITDPPYTKECVPLYGQLAQVANYILKSGGSLVAMCGQSYLPEIYSGMTQHLEYHWTWCYLTPGAQSPVAVSNYKRVNSFWKPVLWFTKGKYSGPQIGDVIKSDKNDKRYHRWGQSEVGMVQLIERVTGPGDLVLDPFLGGGTTALACYRLGRRFIGIDIDESAIETTKERLNGK